ncbi:MAG: hypothetical protein Q9160_007109 [Pyrenula sp. 1 TL-2023]
MSYNTLTQDDHEVLSEGTGSIASGTPSPIMSRFQPIPTQFENLSGSLNMEDADPAQRSTSSRLNSMLRTMASGTSYEMVEDDDYEEPEALPPKSPDQPAPMDGHAIDEDEAPPPPPHTVAPVPLPPIRTASISHSLPLRHPTPDLQSLQGAYVGNVERLEQSAERLSISSSMDEEIQRMKEDQRQLERQHSAPVGATTIPPPPARQYSVGSHANSIIDLNNTARAGGYSPGGFIGSPHGSIQSDSRHLSRYRSRGASQSSRLSTLPEPQKEGRPLDSPIILNSHQSRSILQSPEQVQSPATVHQPAAMGEENRPASAASNDTYRQANALFVDFDGTHYDSNEIISQQGSIHRQVSIDRPPLASEAMAHDKPPHENMVFYPAPVPMMLNLPQKLSKLPTNAERERRRLQGTSQLPANARKSAAWLNDDNGRLDPSDKRRTQQKLSGLPAHLRASAFFDHPAHRQEVQLMDNSAVATLDSILDAAAHAPVSAFTDHPIVGKQGANIYAKQRVQNRKSSTTHLTPELDVKKNRRKSSFSNLLKPRDSAVLTKKDSREVLSRNGSKGRFASRESKEFEYEDTEAGVAGRSRGGSIRDRSAEMEEAAEQSLLPSDDELDDTPEHQEEDAIAAEDYPVNGAPTTLLAELQMRKAQQKTRTRTAVTAFPNGMHSTLLELDTIAQIQKRSREKKHVTLAWEDGDEVEKENFDDEDVPLGVLYPGQQTLMNRQMGLMEKREAEENEPLSRRRARLRGDPQADLRQSVGPSRLGLSLGNNRSSAMLSRLEIPKSPQAETTDPEEGETLGQRVKRLKAQREAELAAKPTPMTGDFASDVLSMLTKDEAPSQKQAMSAKAKGKQPVKDSQPPPAEETLGQRRKRLKEEAARNVSAGAAASPVNGAKPLLKARHSMADILTGYPAGRPEARQVSQESVPEKRSTMMLPRQASGPIPRIAAGIGFGGAIHRNSEAPVLNRSSTMNAIPASGGAGGPFGNGGYIASGMPAGIGMPWQYPFQGKDVNDTIGMGPPLDRKQRDVIERWRSSVVL